MDSESRSVIAWDIESECQKAGRRLWGDGNVSHLDLAVVTWVCIFVKGQLTTFRVGAFIVCKSYLKLNLNYYVPRELKI